MRGLYLHLILVMTLMISCTSNNSDNENNSNEIIDPDALLGWWLMTDVQFSGTLNDSQILADEVVEQSVQLDCNLVSFLFEESGLVSIVDKVNYVEINQTQTGMDECPTQGDATAAFWTLEGNLLTLDYGNGTIETISIQLDGNTIIITGEDINENNYAGADVIFTLHH